MDRPSPPPSPAGQDAGSRSPWPWLLGAGCLLVVLLGILLPHPGRSPASQAIPTNAASGTAVAKADTSARARRANRISSFEPAPDAREVVADKVIRFAQDRLGLVYAMAQHYKVAVPQDVERFFAAVQAGHWEEIHALFNSLRKLKDSSKATEDLKKLWPAILETFGVAEVAHYWPAQKLLDYGQAVLGSLRPGMVYVGGTDSGRFIPTLLNETDDGERRVVLTQNALADGSYLEYLRFLYSDRMTLPTSEDSQRAFQDYTSDAQKRLVHDQQFPDEPKQLRPGEEVRIVDGQPQVSGQVSVMLINEKLFQMIMDKNPSLSFGLQESFPFKSTYPNATPLGPIMELGVPDVQKTFTADAAAQTVDYWRNASQSLLADSENTGDSPALKAYSKMAVTQAKLLEDHSFSTEAEQTYRLATDMGPSEPEAVFCYAGFLTRQKRFAEAIPVVETAVDGAPGNQQFRDLLQNLKRVAAKH
jgi:hypothetical protein